MWKKIGSGILFVAACFAAMYVLVGYYENKLYVGIAAGILLIAAFIFLDVVFLDKIKKLMPKEEEMKEEFHGVEGDFQKRTLKHFQEMENTQKELLEVLKNQNTLLQNQIDNLEHEIYLLSEKQVNQAKSIIKFNKENARQLAISERETLEYVMTELKKAIEKKGDRSIEEEETELSEVPEDLDLAALFDIPEFTEEPAEEPAEEVVLPVEETLAEENLPDLAELMAEALMAEEPAVEEVIIAEAPAVEEVVAEEEPAVDPFAGLSSDPNAMMTPEDIAKLLEAMGQ